MKSLKITLLLLVTQVMFSQTGNFNAKLNQISSTLQKVENAKSNFEQSVTSKKAGVANYVVKETSKKGKVKETEYEFNFADIDVNTVRYETSKDIIKVQLIVKQNQKMIKKTIDKEKVSFQDELFFIATDVDNARKLVKIVKEIIPVANTITERRLSLHGFGDRLNWLTKNIQEVSSTEKKCVQKLSKNNSYPASVTYESTTSKGKQGVKKVYDFNLSNINPNTVHFKNKGSDFILNLETKRKLKTVKLKEDGVVKGYINKFEIVCKNVENARELQKVLQDIIPLAQKRFESSMPSGSSVSSALNVINQKIKKISLDKATIEQNIKGDCVVVVSKTEENSKEKTESKYEFNFADINKQDVDIVIKGKKAFVVAKTTAKNKFIKYTKNKEQQNYVNELELICNSAEDAIICKKMLENGAGLCNKRTVSVSKSLSGLQQQLKKVTLDKSAYEQKIESLSSGDVKFTSTKVSDKKSEEGIQEFKLTDINPKSVEIKVSGKKVMVEFATNYQEKIIKTYKNGQIKSYTNKVLMYCDSVENARKIAEILKGITGKK